MAPNLPNGLNRLVLQLSAWLLALTLVVGFSIMKQVQLEREQAVLAEQLRALRVEIDDIYTHGSPITDRRLTILEYRAGVK